MSPLGGIGSVATISVLQRPSCAKLRSRHCNRNDQRHMDCIAGTKWFCMYQMLYIIVLLKKYILYIYFIWIL